MKYANLGNTGISVSRLCLGMMTYGDRSWRDWVLEYDEALPFVDKALELGINFFDTADVYSNGVSEEILGRALRTLNVDREDVVIATKCFGGTHGQKRNRFGLNRKYVMAACDASLKRLGMDYIDLYQIHRFDYRTPMEETIDALNDLVRAGKVRYLGASSMFAWQFAKYLFTQDDRRATRFISMQNHYNLLYREEEREMNPLCADQGVGLIPWSPLARGYLARGPQAMNDTLRSTSDEFMKNLYKRDADRAVIAANAQVAEKLGVKPMQTALAWLLRQPGVVSPIIGASKLSHLEDAAGVFDVALADDDIQALESGYVPTVVSGHQ